MTEEIKPPQTEAQKTGQTPATVGHDPFTAFRHELDRMVDSFFGKRPLDLSLPARFGALAGAPEGFMSPQVDVTENDEKIVVTAELPGMAEDEVDLSLKNGVLTLEGEKRSETTSDEDDRHVTERRFGKFRRAFTLPDSVDEEQVAAAFQNGVLTVTLPKKPQAAAQTRKIEISKS